MGTLGARQPANLKHVTELGTVATSNVYILLSLTLELVPQLKMVEYVAMRGIFLSLVSFIIVSGPEATPNRHVIRMSFTDLPPIRQKSVVFNTSCAKYSQMFPLSGKRLGSKNPLA